MKKLLQTSLPPLQEMFLNNAAVYRFAIDCAMLVQDERFFYNRHSGYLGSMFTTLDKITAPCIYWFEASDAVAGEQVKKDLEAYRQNPERNNRNIPAANKNSNSKVIYVGRRHGGFTKKTQLSHIAGRIYHHLGYYGVPTTQGLQLIHWSKAELKLSVLELPLAAKPYLSIFERLFAIELSPLTGKHDI